MNASGDNEGTQRAKASVRDAIGKLLGDDAACERAEGDAAPATDKKPMKKK